MNKEYYEELKKEIEKFDSKSILLDPNKKRDELQKLINSNFSAYADKNISAVIAFYEYTFDKPEYGWLNEHYTKILSGYFSKASIERKFDSIMDNDNRLLLDSIIMICNDSVIKDLISVAYEKSKTSENYKTSYDLLKNKLSKFGIDAGNFLDIELSTDLKDNQNVSTSGLNVIEKVNDGSVDSIPVYEPFKSNDSGDTLLKAHEERVNAATNKINDMVKERGVDPVENPLDKSIDLNMFSSSNSAEEKNIRHEQINERRNDALKHADEIVDQAASTLDVNKKNVYKALDKQGIRPIKLREGDIVISPEMVKQVAANGMVDTMPMTRYVKFVKRLFATISFKMSDIEVSEVDNRKKIFINPGSKEQKIAKAESNLLKIQRMSQSVKRFFVDTKDNAKKTFEKVALKVSGELRNIADRITPEYDNPYDVSGKAELDYFSLSNAHPEIYVDPVELPSKKETSILELAEGLRNGDVKAISGSRVGEIPYPLLEETNNKKM